MHVAALFLMKCFTGKKPERWTVAAERANALTTAAQLLGGGPGAAVGQQCHFFCPSVCLSVF